MERYSSPLRTPNTFRDSNEVSSKRELTQPAAAAAAAAAANYVVEPMDFDLPSAARSVNADDRSILRHDDGRPNRVTNRPLPRAIVHPERTDDRQANPVPRAAPERILYNNEPLLEASGFDTSRHAALSADEAYALQLQQEEYSRDSLATPRHPFLPFRYESDDDDDGNVMPSAPPHVIDTPHPQFTGDAEFAAFLQQQENRSRGRSNRHPGMTYPARYLSHPQPSEVFQVDEHVYPPMPHMFLPYPHRNGAPNADDSDEEHDPRMNIPHPLLRLLARSNHFGGFPGRGFRRSGNLQDTEDDFGPDDYERLLRLDDTVRKKKLTNDQINSIPIETFTRTSNNSDEENKCAVCLDLFDANQVLRRFSCRHLYHKECADRWLQENNVCPICREMPVKVASTGHSRSNRGAYHPRRPTNTQQAPTSRPSQHRRGRSFQRPS